MDKFSRRSQLSHWYKEVAGLFYGQEDRLPKVVFQDGNDLLLVVNLDLGMVAILLYWTLCCLSSLKVFGNETWFCESQRDGSGYGT
jgi:hypothetical protein